VNAVRAVARFWYDFIVGDDWKIAAGVVVAVGFTVALLKADVLGDAGVCVVGALLVAVAFAISLVVDVRRKP
jgi:hypothetical protein